MGTIQSQMNQDEEILKRYFLVQHELEEIPYALVRGKFLEIGGVDGIDGSNAALQFERVLQWSGILIIIMSK